VKKVTILLFVVALTTLSSCAVKLVGKVNMISDRSIESNANYVMLRSGMGTVGNVSADKKKKRIREIKKNRAKTIEAAIDQTLKNTAGGEFIKNVTIYQKGKFFAVDGDVWGLTANSNIHGFMVGDKVQWKVIGKILTGIITDLKDAANASVKQDADGKVKNVPYEKLSKVE